MARSKEREEAIKLRKQGKSYGQIKDALGISKSTLSGWLRDLPLSKEQLNALDTKQIGIEKFRRTMKKKRVDRRAHYYREEQVKWAPISEKELFLAGLFLYWGEGNKSSSHTIALYNTDPEMLRFALVWITKSLQIPKSKVKVGLHLYSDMDTGEEITFWSKKLGIPSRQFYKPHIKKSKRETVSYKSFGHGTCSIIVHDTAIKERFEMALRAVLDSVFTKL